MTLIVGIPTSEGIVLASDTQVTFGDVRSTDTKIYKVNSNLIWSASGELSLIQRVSERIATLANKNNPLRDLRDKLAEFVKQSVEELLNLDFRTQFLKTDPNALLSLHPGDFIFLEYRKSPEVLHVLANGTAEWIKNRPIASGSGGSFAYALLKKYDRLSLNLQMAAVLAYKTIEESIQVGAFGIGEPIDVWWIDKNGCNQLDEQKIALLKDTAKLIREDELAILAKPQKTN